MTLDDLRQAIAARGLICLNIAHGKGGWQTSARSEGSAWLVGSGATIEEALHRLLAFASVAPAWVGKTRYFVGADGALQVTYNGEPPLRYEGSFTEVSAADWAARRRQMDAPKAVYADDLEDLL